MSGFSEKMEEIIVFVKKNGVHVPKKTLKRIGKLVVVHGVPRAKLETLNLSPKKAKFMGSVMDMIDGINDPSRNFKELAILFLNDIRKY